MFLTIPRHEILAHEGIRRAYSSKLFYDLCAYRDREAKNTNTLLHRVTCEMAYAGLALISLIEAIVRIPFVCIGIIFSSNRKYWIEGVHTAILTTLFSLSALVYNLFVKRITEHLVQLECSLRFFSTDQLLFQACETGQYNVAKKLIEESKANPHLVQKEQVSAALIPHLTGQEQLQDLFELNKYEKGYLELKRLSHWLGLDGKVELEGNPLKLQGAQSHWLFESLAESFQRFRTWDNFSKLDLTPTKADILQNALIKAYAEHSYDAIATRIRKRELTFVSSGWQDHAICLAFYGNYMAIGNRGYEKTPTLEVFKVDPHHMTPEIIEEIFMHQHLDEKTGEKYFYHALPQKLSSKGKIEKDDICKRFSAIAPKIQKAENCALASKKAALRFAWAMLLEKPPSEQTLKRARLESKLYSDWVAVQYLEEADIDKKYPHMQEFSDIAHRKGCKKDGRFTKLSWNLPFAGFLSSIYR